MVNRSSPRRKRMLHLLGLVALPLLLALGCSRGPALRDPRVLVMNFENTIENHGSTVYTRSLAEMMTSCLANYPRVAIVERQDLTSLFEKLQNSPKRWQEIGRKAKVDYVIAGSIARLDQNFILNARLLSVATGDIVRGSSVTRYCKREEDLYPVVQAMSRIMAAHLKYLAEYYEAQARGAQAPLRVEAPPAAPSMSAPPVSDSQ